jgi:hypothetical protein
MLYVRGAPLALPQMAVACSLAVLACVSASVTRPAYYFATDHGPYFDLGFEALPAWTRGEYPHLTLQLVTVFFLTLVFGMFLSHRTPWASLRRFLLVFGTAQLLAVVCHLSTFMADPNPGWKGRPPELFPVLFTVGGLYAGFYREAWPRTGIAVMAVGLAGTLLSLACRMQYTVDALCDAGIAAATFFTYEWEMRSRWSVTRRGRFFAWLEADVLVEATDAAVSGARRGGYGTTEDQGYELSDALVHGFEPAGREPIETVLRQFVGSLDVPNTAAPAVAFMLMMTAGMTLLVNWVAADIANSQRSLHRGFLPDTVHTWTLHTFGGHLSTDVPDVWTNVLVTLALLDVAVTHPLPLVAVSRISLITVLTFTLRAAAVVATTIADDPAAECTHRVHRTTDTCGDILYSGHALAMLVSFASLTMFRESLRWYAFWFAATAVGLALIVVSLFHYTRDVLTAVIIYNGAVSLLDTVLFARPDRVARSYAKLSLDLPFYLARLPDETEGGCSYRRLRWTARPTCRLPGFLKVLMRSSIVDGDPL